MQFENNDMLYFQQLFMNAKICGIFGKLSELHLNGMLFSNRRGKILNRRTTIGQICSTFLGPFPSVFHKYHQCQHFSMSAISETTFQFIVVLRLRGEGPKSITITCTEDLRM